MSEDDHTFADGMSSTEDMLGSESGSDSTVSSVIQTASILDKTANINPQPSQPRLPGLFVANNAPTSGSSAKGGYNGRLDGEIDHNADEDESDDDNESDNDDDESDDGIDDILNLAGIELRGRNTLTTAVNLAATRHVVGPRNSQPPPTTPKKTSTKPVVNPTRTTTTSPTGGSTKVPR